MNDFSRLDVARSISDVYIKAIDDLHELFHRHTTIKILVVLDGGISLTEGSSVFGVGRVVRLLRETTIGCTRFLVDTARRENNAGGAPTYVNFRFDRMDGAEPVINKYHEIWCFGFNPDNAAGPDSNITQPGALPTSDAELKVLTQWMNDKRGGLLAIGDHDYLGASMCHRIPRIRSMRRWTNAQGVPPIGGAGNPDTALRHDTNQPFTAAQLSGTATIPFLAQEDTKPQTIDWVPWISQQVSIFQLKQRPHPVLCHPVHGPIDVLPDHPHEGWCFEDADINLAAPLGIPTLTGDEYPMVGGNRPHPTIIAHGTTTPNPPYLLEKGPSPKKRFGMISVYDGHPANVGRVATDSTWHHWFDENIQAIEAAGGVNWAKISRYYLNVATWLAPPSTAHYCFAFEVLASHFTYLGFQEYSPRLNVFDLGKPLHAELIRYYGPCWVTSWVFDHIRLVDADFWAWLKDRLFWKHGIPVPGGDPCLSCPSFELIEIAVLGGLVRASFPIADEIKAHVAKNGDKPVRMQPDTLVKNQLEGVKIGLKEFRGALAKSVQELQPLIR
jgi:hypothetical protein